MSILADGEVIEDRRSFAAEHISRGVVLELGHRVVLLLHFLPAETSEPLDSFGLMGESPKIINLRREITRLANMDVSILLRGETGSGKELVARALHEAGNRHRRPFVAVSLAALQPNLAAAELFGSKKGAYTGADRDKPGYFRKADGGTLFLDEIGEAPAEVQVLLLRALETGEILPVGETEPARLDVRIIAATDADLEAAMAKNTFRSPLFHRLAGYALLVPPLRQRRDDIGRLFFHFLEEELRRLGIPTGEQISVAHAGRPWPDAGVVARLTRADWPGNVRELRNVARWMAVKGPGTDIADELDGLLGDVQLASEEAAHVTEPRRQPLRRTAKPATLHRPPRDVSDEELLEALRLHGWRLKPTATYMRVSRTSLYALIDRCPQIRRASDLTADELLAAFEQHGNDLSAMSTELEVSPQGLRHRLQELDIPPRTSD